VAACPQPTAAKTKTNTRQARYELTIFIFSLFGGAQFLRISPKMKYCDHYYNINNFNLQNSMLCFWDLVKNDTQYHPKKNLSE
jgi:hypothetical protein